MSGEDILWSLGLLGTNNPEVLLVTVMFTLGLSCSLRAGKEHHVLRSIPFESQFTFYTDSEGNLVRNIHQIIGIGTPL